MKKKDLIPSSEVSGLRTFDPFRVLSDEERRRHLDAYLSVLEARNGEIDLPQRKLSRRELYFRDLDSHPIESRDEIDCDGVLQWLSGEGTPHLDAREAFLVMVGRVNESERYGVELELERFDKTGEHAADRRQLYLFLEEGYHSRILLEICRACGVKPQQSMPPWNTRWLIDLVRHLPDRVRWILVLCGEVVGCTIFRIMVEHCQIFADDPELEKRLRALLEEIWLDEVQHVAFVRARLGPRAIRFSRLLLPLVVRGLTKHVPQLAQFGYPPAELMARVRAGVEMPPRAEWIEPAAPSQE